MQKEDIIKSVVAVIEKELIAATRAARDSASEATDDESRPENKYDTRGLEASYVASAQAHYAKELTEALQAYRNLNPQPGAKGQTVSLASIVTTLSTQGRELFFIGPARGGLEIETEGSLVTVLTPSSPLGSKLLGKTVGAQVQDAGKRAIIRIS